MKFIINHIYIFLTIFLAVASQLIMKWQMSQYSMSDYSSFYAKFIFALTMLVNPFIVLSIFLTLLSGLSWMIAMTKFDISYAYPFTSLGFVLILLFSSLFFHETIDINKGVGVVFIIIGILFISRGV